MSANKIPFNNSIRFNCPEAADVWKYDLNGEETPDTVSIYSTKEYYFGCKNNEMHVFKRNSRKLLNRRGEYIGCKFCGPNAKEAFPGDNDFLTLCEMAKKEWAYELNPEIDPTRTRALSAKYAYFRCDMGHISHRKISDYFKSPGCQICRKEASRLIEVYPVLRVFYDESRNEVNINSLILSSQEMIWVRCPECRFENYMGVQNWRANTSCRCCGYDGINKKSVQPKSSRPFLTFRMSNPIASSYWDYNKNDKDKTPDSCRQASNYMAYFKCDNGHEFKRAIQTMYDKKTKEPISCPFCESRKMNFAIKGKNDFFTVCKHAKDFWDYDANKGIDPFQLLSHSMVKVSFRCPDKGHRFTKTISGFTTSPTCPECRKYKSKERKYKRKREFKSFAEHNPAAIKQLVAEKTGNLDPRKIYWHSTKKVTMQCVIDPKHIYEIKIKDIPLEEPYGCPFCSGRLPFPGQTDLFSLLPLAKEMWNDHGQERRDLAAINPHSKEKVSFKCVKCGFEFKRQIRDFYLGDHSCPKCKRLRNSVAKCKKLMDQWDYEANSNIDPNTVNVSSHIEVGWKCKICGYTWRSQIESRYVSKGLCPSHEVRIVVHKGANTLSDLVPDILLDFDQNDNPKININKLSVSSSDVLTWTCHVCGYKWRAGVSTRITLENGKYKVRHCRACNGTIRTKSYAEEFANLRIMYSKEKNEESFDALMSSDNLIKTFWWDCQNKDCGESFLQRLDVMIRASKKNTTAMGCPYCAGKKVTREKSFASLHPDLLLEYDPSNTIDPFTVSENSNKIAVWRCTANKAHTNWQAPFYIRTIGGKKCPECYRPTMLSDVRPDLREFFLEKNRKPFDKYTLKSNELIYLNCPKGHEYKRTVFNISEEIGNNYCPVCSCSYLVKGQNDLASQCDEYILQSYDLSKNERKPDEITILDDENDTWWTCNRGHSFNMSVKKRLQDKSCPICEHKTIVPGVNSFATENEELAKEVSPNESVNLDTISPLSKFSPLWRCTRCGYDYRYQLINRKLNDNVCPVCTGKRLRADVNSLAVTNPELAKELDPNGKYKATELMETYAKEVSWICQRCGETYIYPVRDRRVGDNVCPVCNGKKISANINSLAVTNPELAKELDPNGKYNATELMETYAKEVSWICQRCGETYIYPVRDRRVGDNVCPVCNYKRIVPGKNSLKAMYPELIEEWDVISNYLLCDPDRVSHKDTKKVWWICRNCGRHYPMKIKDRVMAQFRNRTACTFEKGRRFKRNYQFLDRGNKRK